MPQSRIENHEPLDRLRQAAGDYHTTRTRPRMQSIVLTRRCGIVLLMARALGFSSRGSGLGGRRPPRRLGFAPGQMRVAELLTRIFAEGGADLARYEAQRDAATVAWRAVCLDPRTIQTICAAPCLNDRKYFF